MKNIFSLLFVGVLSIALSGCGGNNTSSNYSSSGYSTDSGDNSMNNIDMSSMNLDMSSLDGIDMSNMDIDSMLATMMGGGQTGAGENTNPEYRLLGEINVTIAPQYGDPSGMFFHLASAQAQNGDERISEPTYARVSNGYLVQLPAYAINPATDTYYPQYNPEYNYFKFTLPSPLPTMQEIMQAPGKMISYRLQYPASVPNMYYPPEYQVYGFGNVNIMYIDAQSYASVGAIIIGGYILADVFTDVNMTKTKNVFVTFGSMIFQE